MMGGSLTGGGIGRHMQPTYDAEGCIVGYSLPVHSVPAPASDAAKREVLGWAVLAFTDASASGFVSVPAGTNHAELQFNGSGARWTTAGTAPTHTPGFGFKSADGAVVELEGSSEVAGFLVIADAAAGVGEVYVEFHYVPFHGWNA